MLSVSPSPADRGRQETWLAVTPHDRGPFGPVLSGPYEAPSGFFGNLCSHPIWCTPAVPSPLPLRCADFLPLLFIGLTLSQPPPFPQYRAML